MAAVAMLASDYKVDGQYVTVPIEKAKAGGARVVRLQVVSDNIIRVQATSEAQLPRKQSLIVVKQTAKPKFTVSEDDDVVTIKAAGVTAKVDEESGRVEFFDKDGQLLLKEAEDGKTFKPFRTDLAHAVRQSQGRSFLRTGSAPVRGAEHEGTERRPVPI